jgi:hypothetical protein
MLGLATLFVADVGVCKAPLCHRLIKRLVHIQHIANLAEEEVVG